MNKHDRYYIPPDDDTDAALAAGAVVIFCAIVGALVIFREAVALLW